MSGNFIPGARSVGNGMYKSIVRYIDDTGRERTEILGTKYYFDRHTYTTEISKGAPVYPSRQKAIEFAAAVIAVRAMAHEKYKKDHPRLFA